MTPAVGLSRSWVTLSLTRKAHFRQLSWYVVPFGALPSSLRRGLCYQWFIFVARRPRFGYRQQSIHVSQVRNKVMVVVATMESSGSQTWWRGGGVSQAEPCTSAKDTWPIERFCIYKYQLATQVDRQISSASTTYFMYTCLLRATILTGKYNFWQAGTEYISECFANYPPRIVGAPSAPFRVERCRPNHHHFHRSVFGLPLHNSFW